MNKLNLTYNNYLANLDCINKYNLKNINETTKIDYLNFDFVVDSELLKNFSNNNKIFSHKKTTFFFLIYILYSLNIDVDLKKSKVSKSKASLKFKIKNKKDIEFFLYYLFIYYVNNPIFKSFFNFNDVKLFPNSQSTNINCQFKVPFYCLNNLDVFNTDFLNDLDLKEYFFNINIIFKKFNHFNNFYNVFMNYPSFWIYK